MIRSILRRILKRRNSDKQLFAELDVLMRQGQENPGRKFVLDRKDLKLINDKTKSTFFEPHYTYHPAWAARVVRKVNPSKHVDVSSILRFSTIISGFVPTEFYDYRPAKIQLEDFESGFADLINLPFDSNSVYSLSCMHTVEHVGLGRYGDPVDYNGDLKAIEELKRVLAVDGHLLFVVPVGGENKIVFNAHRIYTYETIVSYFKGFELKDFSLVLDDGSFESPSARETADLQTYGCGCFWFRKNNS